MMTQLMLALYVAINFVTCIDLRGQLVTHVHTITCVGCDESSRTKSSLTIELES